MSIDKSRLENLLSITLVVKLEEIDHHCRKSHRVPTMNEYKTYVGCIRELRKRHQFPMVKYYEQQLDNYLLGEHE